METITEDAQRQLDANIAHFRNMRARVQAALDEWVYLEGKLIQHAQEGLIRPVDMYMEGVDLALAARREIHRGLC